MKRTVGDGWVSRADLLTLWPGKPAVDEEAVIRATKKISNTVKRLEKQIARYLTWIFPHLRIEIQRRPAKHASHFRINLQEKGAPWVFGKSETAGHTLPHHFGYRFHGGVSHKAHVLAWATALPGRMLAVEAVREPPEAEWSPPSHPKAYAKNRDEHFEKERALAKKEGRPDLHDSHIWGIREVEVNAGGSSTSVRITTDRTGYSDLHFLKCHLDQNFGSVHKQTYRQWLKLSDDPRGDFCPPRDALCVYVLVLTRKPELTVFFGKQRWSGKWDVTAAGAACSAHYGVDDENPDIANQVCGVLHKETGLKIKKDAIKWLGVARGVTAGCSTGVLALVPTNDDVPQVLQKFKRRREKHDLEELEAVPLAKAREWLETIPPEKREQFLELSLALAAIDQKLAEAL